MWRRNTTLIKEVHLQQHLGHTVLRRLPAWAQRNKDGTSVLKREIIFRFNFLMGLKYERCISHTHIKSEQNEYYM